MSQDTRQAIAMAVFAIVFFGIITDTFIYYTIMVMKAIFFISGILCTLGFFGLIISIIKTKDK